MIPSLSQAEKRLLHCFFQKFQSLSENEAKQLYVRFFNGDFTKDGLTQALENINTVLEDKFCLKITKKEIDGSQYYAMTETQTGDIMSHFAGQDKECEYPFVYPKQAPSFKTFCRNFFAELKEKKYAAHSREGLIKIGEEQKQKHIPNSGLKVAHCIDDFIKACVLQKTGKGLYQLCPTVVVQLWSESAHNERE
jgi:hypothetical protein